MPTQTLIKTSRYYDSVSLMLVAKALTKLAEVQDAAVIMGTEANKGILKEAGLLTPEARAAGANDLVIVIQAGSEGGGQRGLKASRTTAQSEG